MEDDRNLAAGVSEGDVLAGKYRIDKILGAGGMGVVVAAHHIQLDEKVAIKFLLPGALANKEIVARFAREARAAVKIKSEHVARVSDVGTLENGAPYMVMEYLQGGDLSEWLKQRGAMPIEQAVESVLQAGEAIAEAHAIGIVHRDLKPSNLFATRRADGSMTIKVLDFGISKTGGKDPAGMQMTATSSVMGSPLYMSPEQLQSSKDVDARADIWSIGIILYELLTGDSPFQAETMPQLVVGIMSSPPPPLRNKRPEAPLGLEQVILRCLEKDRANRFQSMGELALALLEFAPRRSKISVERITGIMREAGMSAPSLALPPSSDSEMPGSAGTKASWGSTAAGVPKTGSKRNLLIGLGAATAVLVAAGVAVQMSRGAPNPVDSTTSAAPAPTASTAEATPSAAPPNTAAEPTPPASAAPTAPPSAAPKGAAVATQPAAVPVATPAKASKVARPASSGAARPQPAHPGPAKPESGNSWGGRL